MLLYLLPILCDFVYKIPIYVKIFSNLRLFINKVISICFIVVCAFVMNKRDIWIEDNERVVKGNNVHLAILLLNNVLF